MFWKSDDVIQTYAWNGLEVYVNLAFNNVLTFFELMEDEEFSSVEKFYIAFELFVEDKELINEYTVNDRIEFVFDFLKDKLNFDLRNTTREDVKETNSNLTFDYIEDSGRIFASFLYDFKMNLYEQQGQLTWNQFHSLFENLSPEAPFSQAVHYRTVKVPKRDKHNEEEIKHIHAMKEKYALKSGRIKDKVQKQQDQESMNKAMSFLMQVKSSQRGGRENG